MKTAIRTSGSLALLVAMGGAVGCLWPCEDERGDAGGSGGAGTDETTGTSGGESAAAPKLTLGKVVSMGSGCRQPGSVKVALDEDSETVVLTFLSLKLAHPPGAKFLHARCASGFRVLGVAGWQLVPVGVSAHGSVDLPAGALGEPSTTVFFAGERTRNTSEREIPGPRSGPFAVTDVFPFGSAAQSPCGQDATVVINVKLTLLAAEGSEESASIGLEKVEVPFVWRTCRAPDVLT